MLTLIDYLSQLSLEHIHELAGFWGVPEPDSLEPEDLKRLAFGLADDWSARLAVAALNPAQGQVLGKALQGSGLGLEVHQMRAQLGLEVAEFEAAIAWLEHRALAYRSSERFLGQELFDDLRRREPWRWRSGPPAEVQTHELLAPFRELRQPLSRAWNEWRSIGSDRSLLTLTDLLLGTPYDVLEETAVLLRLPGFRAGEAPIRKEYLVEAVRNALVAPGALQSILAQLPGIEQDLVARLRAAGGRKPIQELYTELGQSKAELRPHFKRLATAFLALDTFRNHEHILFIPQSIDSALGRQPASIPPQAGLLRPIPSPSDARPGRPLLPWVILVLLSGLGRERVHLSPKNDLPTRFLTHLAADLEPSVHPWPAQKLLALAQKLCLWAQLVDWQITERRLLPAWTRAAQTMGRTFVGQSAALLDRWVEQPMWTDEQTVNPRTPLAGTLNISLLRQRLVRLLAEAPPDEWYSVEGLIQGLRQRETFFARPQVEIIRRYGYPALSRVPATWDEVEAPAIHGALLTLHWLGAMNLGYAAQAEPLDRPLAFAATSLGQWLASPRETPAPEPPEVDRPLVIQPNFEIIVLSPRLEVLYPIARFSRPVQFDRAARFLLDRESVIGAADNGFTAQDILDHLTDHGRTTIPQNVARSIEEWTQSLKPVHMTEGVILEVENSETMDLLLANKAIAALIERRLGPTAALVRADRDLRKLREALSRGGYAPEG